MRDREDAAQQAWDAYWETGPDDDPAKYGFIQFEPMVRDAFMAGYAAVTRAERAIRITELEFALERERDAAGYWQARCKDAERQLTGLRQELVDHGPRRQP